ncbi:hypothetical protein P4493_06215 [Bacillus thuringiensis]|nr:MULTISPECIES: hypothetical protein [Bacillus]EAO56529.1 hypothetical protein RBTH_05464 [Bacillus thuringiensis serovar israelensis ATCC 35646]MEC2533157.1 hypothetical protein [Bacillus cereus]MED1153861.1 hypothetical protein [Bacillus paranthracis]AFQ30172.1 hypothetical protein BTF1_30357 [Bacillus thuringiensis HD-789]MCC4009094.1 hypothetical protein [Bacillus thuringiensis]
MEQFEYINIDLPKLTKPDGIRINMDKLHELGVEGWEMVLQNSKEFVFKRKVEEGRVIVLDKKYKIETYGDKDGAGVLFKRIAEDESKTAIALNYFYVNRGLERLTMFEETGSEVISYKPVVKAKLIPFRSLQLETEVKDFNGIPKSSHTVIVKDLGEFLDKILKELKVDPKYTVSIEQIANPNDIQINLENLNIKQLEKVIEKYKADEPFNIKEHTRESYKTVEKIIKHPLGHLVVKEFIY